MKRYFFLICVSLLVTLTVTTVYTNARHLIRPSMKADCQQTFWTFEELPSEPELNVSFEISNNNSLIRYHY